MRGRSSLSHFLLDARHVPAPVVCSVLAPFAWEPANIAWLTGGQPPITVEPEEVHPSGAARPSGARIRLLETDDESSSSASHAIVSPQIPVRHSESSSAGAASEAAAHSRPWIPAG